MIMRTDLRSIKKPMQGKPDSNEGILLSLLYLGRELEVAQMLKTKKHIDEALIMAISELAADSLSDRDIANAAAFLKKALLLNKEAMLHLIEAMTEIEQEEQPQD